MGTHGTLFSVVIPAYNAAQWLGQTLESWSRQTVRDFEVIVVDDGSEDATVSVAEAFQGRFNIQILRERHSGAPARPCNAGIRAAKGDLIVHCDADDLASPDRLEGIQHAWEIANRCECLIFSDFSEVDAQGNMLRRNVLADYSALQCAPVEPLSDGVVLLKPDAAFTALLEGSFIRPCAAATSKKILEKIGGFNEKLRNGQDYDLYVRITREYPLVWSPRVLASYRIAPGSISFRSAIQLAPSKLAIFHRLLDLPLTRTQTAAVKRSIALNYESLGYEHGNRGDVLQSLYAYYRAFMQRPSLHLFRGIAASVGKFLLGRR